MHFSKHEDAPVLCRIHNGQGSCANVIGKYPVRKLVKKGLLRSMQAAPRQSGL